jgi:hypothetical protein
VEEGEIVQEDDNVEEDPYTPRAPTYDPNLDYSPVLAPPTATFNPAVPHFTTAVLAPSSPEDPNMALPGSPDPSDATEGQAKETTAYLAVTVAPGDVVTYQVRRNGVMVLTGTRYCQ